MAEPETGRYRKRVDEGRTGDKVAHPDPAAAPLETDAETSGEATQKPLLDKVARRQEGIRRRRIAVGPANETRAGWWGLAGTVVLVVAGLLAGWLFLAGN